MAVDKSELLTIIVYAVESSNSGTNAPICSNFRKANSLTCYSFSCILCPLSPLTTLCCSLSADCSSALNIFALLCTNRQDKLTQYATIYLL